jgi:hypothetical protein
LGVCLTDDLGVCFIDDLGVCFTEDFGVSFAGVILFDFFEYLSEGGSFSFIREGVFNARGGITF